jgi:hypothetical protein
VGSTVPIYYEREEKFLNIWIKFEEINVENKCPKRVQGYNYNICDS